MSAVMRRSLINIGIAAALALALESPRAWAEVWPSRPIKIVCTLPAGGLVDIFLRLYAEQLSQKLGQPVVVENVPGASGSIAAQAVKAAPPDGYTLMFGVSGLLAQNRVLFKNLPYDPDRDFVLISTMSGGNILFVASKTTGARNLKEFIEYARKNNTNVGTWGVGSYAHMVIVELNKQFGLDIEPVHYRGEPAMWQDLAAGALQAGMGGYPNATNVIQSGAGRVVAVSSTKRNRKLPDVPTFADQGLNSKVFALAGYIFLAAPAGTPQYIVERLSDLMVEAGKSERVQKLLDAYGIDESAQGQIASMRLRDSETPLWIDAARALGLEPQ